MKTPNIIGILGGTFDPIHYGHLKIAEHIIEKLPLCEIRFLPNQIPPHRALPHASLSDRIKMIELAIKENPNFKLDLTEANRPGPSYMVDTLKIIQKENPSTSLALILGADAFSHFNTWHRYSEILNCAHLIIVNRPDLTVVEEAWLKDLLEKHLISDFHELTKKPAGFIYEYKITPIAFSSSALRERILQGKSIEDGLPPQIIDYIRSHHLYL
jgi:nicotinate-nucleotide adenylyltransferase